MARTAQTETTTQASALYVALELSKDTWSPPPGVSQSRGGRPWRGDPRLRGISDLSR
jgi:hypothetical protein